MRPSKEVRGNLLRAADLIELRGLAKGIFESDDKGPLCTVKALQLARAKPDYWECEKEAHAIVINLQLPVRAGQAETLSARLLAAVIRWSDAPGNTATDVATALRGMAQ